MSKVKVRIRTSNASEDRTREFENDAEFNVLPDGTLIVVSQSYPMGHSQEATEITVAYAPGVWMSAISEEV